MSISSSRQLGQWRPTRLVRPLVHAALLRHLFPHNHTAHPCACCADVKRYDRQIRLWGLDTQRGLLGTRILLLRATGLCNEAAKNLVLAGVGHVSIQDSGIITADDLASGAVFSMRKTDIGRNKAEAMVEHLQPLNPSVDMAAVTQPLESLTDDFRRQFQYIIGTHGVEGVHEVGQCVTRLSTEAAATADGSRKRPREATGDDPEAKGSNGAHVLVPMRKTEPLPKMLAAGAPGMFGFLALDLLHQQHTVVTKLMTKATAGVPAPVSSRYQVAYPTIADAFGVAWNSLQPRSPPLYCALQLLLSAKVRGPTCLGTILGSRAVRWLPRGPDRMPVLYMRARCQ
jgi:ubiquitin-like 1-activating enzyme E1 A